MKEEEAKRKYGKLWNKIKKSKWLDGITVSKNKDGIWDIPQEDIDRAYNSVILGIEPIIWD